MKRRCSWLGVLALLTLSCDNDKNTDGDDSFGDASATATDTNPTDTDATASMSGPLTFTTAEETGPDPGVCGYGSVCLTEPPFNWEGPVVVFKGDPTDIPICEDPYPANETLRFQGFAQPDPTSCDCECGVDPNSCNINISEYSTDTCGTYVGNTVGTAGCFPYDQPSGGLFVSSWYSGACMVNNNEVIPEIPWEAQVKACRGNASDWECDAQGRVCIAEPPDRFEAEVCILRKGEHECPEGDYSERTIMYTDVDDTRDCSQCVCGTVSQQCAMTFDSYASTDCSGSSSPLATSGCNGPVNIGSIDFTFDAIECPKVSDGEAMGEVAPIDPHTYCCAPMTGE